MVKETLENFQEFSGRRIMGSDEAAVVSINKGGRFGISKGAYNRYLKGFYGVRLLYNPKEKAVAIVRSNEKDQKVIPLKFTTTCYFSSKSFFVEFGIDLDKLIGQKFNAEWYEDSGALIFRLG